MLLTRISRLARGRNRAFSAAERAADDGAAAAAEPLAQADAPPVEHDTLHASAVPCRRPDGISGWLLDETAPVSLPGPRWNRALYPIRDCEQYLRSRAPNL